MQDGRLMAAAASTAAAAMLSLTASGYQTRMLATPTPATDSTSR